MRSRAVLSEQNGLVEVFSPWSNSFNLVARLFKGRWERGRWIFDCKHRKAIEYHVDQIYGSRIGKRDGQAPFDLKITLKANTLVAQDWFEIMGQEIFSICGQDAPRLRTGPNVQLNPHDFDIIRRSDTLEIKTKLGVSAVINIRKVSHEFRNELLRVWKGCIQSIHPDCPIVSRNGVPIKIKTIADVMNL